MVCLLLKSNKTLEQEEEEETQIKQKIVKQNVKQLMNDIILHYSFKIKHT